MYTKDEIINEIIDIREQIGHDFVEPEIKDLYFYDNELTIIAPDRPEKSIIIGKGGWVVGKLREKLGLKSIHVISYTDIILKEYQLELSVKNIQKLLTEEKIPQKYVNNFNHIHDLLKQKQKAPYDNSLIEMYIEENLNRKCDENAGVIVALSGGVDSSFSVLLAKSLGFNVKCASVDPGSIILPKQFRFNIENLCNKINIPHEYIKTDMSKLIDESLNGKIHPCGRCSKHIHKKIEEKLEENVYEVMIFGDLLSTGSQAVVIKNGRIRVNLPALFRMEKTEIKNIIMKYDVKKVKGYGCPLLVQVHKKYPQYKTFSIQRVLRETRAGILEPGEALDLIRTI